ncbi:MAG: hypothetical protein QM784_19035 [Polyangiaceae bacterium]
MGRLVLGTEDDTKWKPLNLQGFDDKECASMVQSNERERIWLVDSTLRDGEQAPSVSFTEAQSREIAVLLAEAGVRELEVGTPAMGAAEQQKMRLIVREVPRVRCTAWCRAREDDLAAAVAAGVPAVHLSVPTSGIQLGALGREWPWVVAELKRLIPLALAHFDYVSVGAQDASRAPVQRLRILAEFASSLGAHRLRLADTVGVWHPIRVLPSRLRGAGRLIGLGFRGPHSRRPGNGDGQCRNRARCGCPLGRRDRQRAR